MKSRIQQSCQPKPGFANSPDGLKQCTVQITNEGVQRIMPIDQYNGQRQARNQARTSRLANKCATPAREKQRPVPNAHQQRVAQNGVHVDNHSKERGAQINVRRCNVKFAHVQSNHEIGRVSLANCQPHRQIESELLCQMSIVGGRLFPPRAAQSLGDAVRTGGAGERPVKN